MHSDHTLSGVMLQLQALRKNRLRMFAMLESFEGFKGCKVKNPVWDFYFTLSPTLSGVVLQLQIFVCHARKL